MALVYRERMRFKVARMLQALCLGIVLLWHSLWISIAAAQTEQNANASRAIAVADAEHFEKRVRPLLVEKCLQCHSNEKRSGGLSLDSRPGWQQGGDSGPAITAGDLDKSLLIEAVRYTNPNLQMPPKQALKPAEVEILEQWVRTGAHDPRESSTPANKPIGMSIEEGRTFWSYLPISNPAIPSVSITPESNTPIDYFIAEQLQKKGIEGAPSADPRTLIRRVSFDLTGLPPTYDEVEAFANDDRPDAYERLVNRLLASPQYGVRWGRHWLDVARYADSNGLDENLAFGNAWRYRDYVVSSWNEDKPFDRFVTEQIAGDLLPDADRNSLVATGFLVLGAKVLAEPDRTKLEMDTIDEQIDTLGKAFLGMTWGCVRCHDHKFDPFKQVDYYSLAAIFRSTKTFGDGNLGAIKYWNEVSLATPEERQALKKVDEEIAAKKSAAAKYKAEAVAKVKANARAKAAKYLAAAAQLSVDSTSVELQELATKEGLHPRILFHCRRHAEFHVDDPLFEAWKRLRSESNFTGIEEHYSKLFAESDTAWAEAKQKQSDVKSLSDDRLEQARLALNDPSGFLAVPAQVELAIDKESLEEYHRLAEIARLAESRAPDEPSAMAVQDGRVQTSLAVHIRGSHHNLGEEVPRGVPVLFRGANSSSIFSRRSSGRLQLAHWLASPDNPLVARVLVNRIWRWHFGVGLVSTTDNFGALGERPSHPELLDWLARNLIESDWSIKNLHRQIVLSAVYRQSSVHPRQAECHQLDPENRLIWSFRRTRLDAEQMRDAILFVCGRLDGVIGGKSVPLRNRQFVFDHTSIDHTRYESLRRAAFLPIIRNNVYEWFEQLDFPDPTMPTGSRNETTVAPQALLLMNSPIVLDSADRLAQSVMETSSNRVDRIHCAYRLILSREPSENELSRVDAFLKAQVDKRPAVEGQVTSDEESPSDWLLVCQALLASNEFVYIK